jgi:fused signal recognition particle receptor
VIALWIVIGVLAFLVLGGVLFISTKRRPSAPSRRAGPVEAPPRSEEGQPAGGAPTEQAVVVEEPTPPAPPVPPALRERLGRTRGLFAPLRGLAGRADRQAAFDAAEEALLRADVGVETTGSILDALRRDRTDADSFSAVLAEELHDVFAQNPDRTLRIADEPGVVNVWLFVGVNGVGKTTTIGKVALSHREQGRSVLLAAGDTFRAAAADQLALWGERSGTEVVRGAEGADPSSVVFDAVQRAKARGHDLVLADTAGRLHTKVNLIEELRKIRRVADREPGRVSEVLLVLDATTGQNALVQARQFTEAVGVTGVVLTKLDGTAKGGVVIPIERQLGLPVKLVGVGEGPGDLIAFDPEAFVDALLGQ